MGADFHSTPHPLLLPLLTRGKRQLIDSHVVHFVPGASQFAVVRQSGLPVHDVALSKKRFSLSAISDLKKIVANVQPDLIHAWGTSAQPAAKWLAGKGSDAIPLVWSVSRTSPLKAHPGFLDKWVFDFNKRYAKNCQRIVYTSAASSAQHRRAGISDHASAVIATGVDVARYKPDPQAREKMRKQLELPKDAVLIGMYAPFQPEFDHANFVKAVGEIVRLNTNAYVVFAGRAMVRGNAPLMAMIGGGTLGTRTRMIGEWSDFGALFNGCDVVCSSATTDSARLMLATAMLCGVLCVGTSVGSQGEVIGNFGASVEPGSPEAMVRGLRRILDMPIERKAFMVREARKHILQNFNMTRSIEKYHELYFELVTGSVPEGVVTPIAMDLDVPYTVIAPSMSSAAPVKETSAADMASSILGTNKSTASPSKSAVEVIDTTSIQSADTKVSTIEKPVEITKTVETPAAPEPIDKPFEIDLTPTTSSASSKIQHNVTDNVMDWSEADAQLIESVIVKDEETKAAIIKPIEAKTAEAKSEPKSDAKSDAKAEAKATEAALAKVQALRAQLLKAQALKALAGDHKPVTPSTVTKPTPNKVSEPKAVASQPAPASEIKTQNPTHNPAVDNKAISSPTPIKPEESEAKSNNNEAA